MIQDQNDNAPQVLYPVQSGASVVAEIVPRSADVGYLVTKVVAVDVDSGQNAWLSYKLQKATDRALFEVGLQNGEIRTVRQVTDKDAVKQRLTVVVEDNGQPSRSATVNVNVAVADSFPEVLSEFTDFYARQGLQRQPDFYLVLALAVVRFSYRVYSSPYCQSNATVGDASRCFTNLERIFSYSVLSASLRRRRGHRNFTARVQL